MNTRNRSEGWAHAKLSGHSNEEIISSKIKGDVQFKKALSTRLGMSGNILEATVGGLYETNVLDVFGGKTKSKTDLVISQDVGKNVNVSIKKSASGQVYLIGVNRFFRGYEAQFNDSIDPKVKRAIELFFGSASDVIEILDSKILAGINTPAIKRYEKKKHRLTWNSLERYDPTLASGLIEWFKLNIKNIAIFCFSRGLSANYENWAEYIWYKNEVGEPLKDSIFSVKEMVNELSSSVAQSQIKPGSKLGGTTIQLPFGSVQWHQEQMQFRHDQNCILTHCSAL